MNDVPLSPYTGVPEPRMMVDRLIRHRVVVHPRVGGKWEGVITGTGWLGFSLDVADGIGGTMRFRYYEVSRLVDLGAVSGAADRRVE